MSRSNRTETVDPANLYIRWSSNDKCFQSYDKEKLEKSLIKLPFAFIVLDQLQAVSGYSEKAECGIYSNMLRERDAGIFKVKGNKSHPNFPIVGKWADIKEKVDFMGGRWTKVIYALAKKRDGSEEYEIVKIELSGAAVSSYINNLRDPYAGAVTIKEALEGKKGSVTYSYPKFEMTPIGENLEKKAEEADVVLQKYINDTLKQDVFEDSDMVNENEAQRTRVEEEPGTTAKYPVSPQDAVPPPSEKDIPPEPGPSPTTGELPFDDEPTNDLPF